MQGSYKPTAFVTLITAVILAPFLNKAFHVDDPLFIWMAQQITRHPFDPYGFEVNWVSFTQPMSVVMQNPPFCSYYLALVGSLCGWSEFVLHLAFLIWPIISTLGTFALARRFCREPLLAALLALFTPAFLVSATSLMCDVMMLAFWVWALELWLNGLDRQRWWYFLASALLISAAALTKYFGITLVPLLAIYTVARQRKPTAILAYLLIPIAVLSNYDLLGEEKYGRGLFGAAMTVSGAISAATRPSHLAQILIGLAFNGGCFASVLFFARFGERKWLLAAVLSFVGFATAFRFFIVPRVYLETSAAPVSLEGGLFATIGAGILTLAVIDLVRRKDADALLLFLWILGTFLFATFLNWSITARTFLPLGPAVAILTIRYRDWCQKIRKLEYLSLVAAAVLSILVAITDQQLASCARSAARIYRERYGAEADKVHFLGHWGFQYYMEQWGAHALDKKNSGLAHGDVVISPFSDKNSMPLSTEEIARRDEIRFKVFPFLTTIGLGAGGGFYSSLHGPVPWIINKIPPERYSAVEMRE